MKKTIITIFVIIFLVVVFLLASPVYYGKQTRRFINKGVAAANKEYAAYDVKVTVSSYKRRWYNSYAVLDVAINNPQFKHFYKLYIDPQFDMKTPFVYQEHLTIKHGPVIYHSNHGIQFSAARVSGSVSVPAELSRQLKLSMPFAQFSGTVSYGGTFKGSFIVAPIHFQNADVTFNWKGMAFNGLVKADLSHLQGTYVAQPMILQLKEPADKQKKIKAFSITTIVSPVTTTFNLHRTPQDLWVGKTNVDIKHEKVVIHDASNKMHPVKEADYRGMQTHLQMQQDKQNYSAEYGFNLQSLQVQGKEQAKDVDVDLAISNLDTQVVRELQRAFVQDLSDKTGRGQHLLDALNNKLTLLVTKKTSVDIKRINMTLPNGKVAISARLNWPEVSPQESFMLFALSTNVDAKIKVARAIIDNFIAKSKRDSDAMMKKPLPLEPGPVVMQGKKARRHVAHKQPATAKYAQQGIDVFDMSLQQGYITQTPRYYQTHIQYHMGRLMANGKKVQV